MHVNLQNVKQSRYYTNYARFFCIHVYYVVYHVLDLINVGDFSVQ